MNVSSKIKGLALAATAATLFAAAPVTATAAEGETGHCMGVNACKGKSSCKTADSACKGQNACKGEGFVAMTEKQCMQLGGDYVAELIGGES